MSAKQALSIIAGVIAAGVIIFTISPLYPTVHTSVSHAVAEAKINSQCETRRKVLDTATVKIITDRFPTYDEYDIWVQHVTQTDLDQEREHLQNLRVWTNTHVTDACVRTAYIDWVNFYESQLKKAYSELQTHAISDRLEAQDREKTQRWADASKLAEQLPQPPDSDSSQ